jgi:hypothetical protein
VIDTPHTYLYYVPVGGRAIRFATGMGREGFTWSDVQNVSRNEDVINVCDRATRGARGAALPDSSRRPRDEDATARSEGRWMSVRQAQPSPAASTFGLY